MKYINTRLSIVLFTILAVMLYNLVIYHSVMSTSAEESIKNNTSSKTKNIMFIKFRSNPLNGGEIYCDTENVSNLTKTYAYKSEIDCQAIAKDSFEFSSWSGSLILQIIQTYEFQFY